MNEINLNNIISETNRMTSLSNDVYVSDEYVIKIPKNTNFDKLAFESEVLNKLGRKNIIIDNSLIIQKENGELKENLLITNDEIFKISKLLVQINNLEIEEAPHFNLNSKINSKISTILKAIGEFSIEPHVLDDLITFSNTEKENILSHRDLNHRNILFENERVTLIDFEQVGYTNKYFDWSTLIFNWDVDFEQIKYISHLNNLNIKNLIQLSLLQTIFTLDWNKEMLEKYGEENYSFEIKKHIKKIKKLNKYLSLI